MITQESKLVRLNSSIHISSFMITQGSKLVAHATFCRTLLQFVADCPRFTDYVMSRYIFIGVVSMASVYTLMVLFFLMRSF